MTEATAIVLYDPEGYRWRMHLDRNANYWPLSELAWKTLGRRLGEVGTAMDGLMEAGLFAGKEMEKLADALREYEATLTWHERLLLRLRRAWWWIEERLQ